MPVLSEIEQVKEQDNGVAIATVSVTALSKSVAISRAKTAAIGYDGYSDYILNPNSRELTVSDVTVVDRSAIGIRRTYHIEVILEPQS